MKIYIAGKITNLDPAVAYENFLAAENWIVHHGHTPLNPMKLVDQDPARTYGEQLADALTVMLTQADGVYFLDNWKDASDGAAIEHFIASRRRMPMWFEGDVLPVVVGRPYLITKGIIYLTPANKSAIF